ncbi:indeterminate(ID)-domain 4 [Rhynchospora pubera]|uniref:Protein EARLY HEADING DATE 2 n=1 Tax=Rhynchospora pubera TaxID=906938 RepID=A0AAV8CA40_9POAL|nr:indeterminate(ID)-domain 4 [Rhynchospora pubera]
MASEAISKAFPLSTTNPSQDINPPPAKKKRNLPGTPDPDAEVIALSPKTLLATNRFLCEICGKGFQRDQNLQLHRRGHNLPWKLRQRSSKEPRKRVYVCPEKSCVHHNPARALGDLTGIKKHFCRKHGEKKWKCEKCSKRYAVQSDWKAHSKTCGTREYRCDCGTLFSRRDSFITHRAFCDALAEETARLAAASNTNNTTIGNANYFFSSGLIRPGMLQQFPSNNVKPDLLNNGDCLSLWPGNEAITNTTGLSPMPQIGPFGAPALYGDLFTPCSNVQSQLENQFSWLYGNNKFPCSNAGESLTSTVKETESSQSVLTSIPSLYSNHQQQSTPPTDMSATALLQKAAQIGVSSTTPLMGSFESKSSNNTPIEECTKFDGLFGSNPQQRNLESALNEFAVTNPYDMFSGRNTVSLKSSLGGGEETRDFLGVGVQTLCTPSINGWI